MYSKEFSSMSFETCSPDFVRAASETENSLVQLHEDRGYGLTRFNERESVLSVCPRVEDETASKRLLLRRAAASIAIYLY